MKRQDPSARLRAAPKTAPFDRTDLGIGCLFVLVSLVLTAMADDSFGFGPDQIAYNVLAEDLVQAWQAGEPLANEFGSVFRQSFAFLHAGGRLLVGDASDSYRLLLGLSALFYLVSMYLLMRYLLGHRGVAALTAVLSLTQRYTLGTSFWGMGEFQSILPRIVVLAVIPLAWLLFVRHRSSKRILGAFLLVALATSLHLSAAFFYCILLATLGLRVLMQRDWHMLPTVAIAAALLPFSLKVVPGPLWSRWLEQRPMAGAGLLLAGVCLVLLHARLRYPRLEALGGWLVAALLLVATAPLLTEGALGSLLGLQGSRVDQRSPQQRTQVAVAAPKPPETEVERPDETSGTALPADVPASSGKTSGPIEPPVAEESVAPATDTVSDVDSDDDVTTGTAGAQTTQGTTTPSAEPASVDAGSEAGSIADAEAELRARNRAIYARFGWTLFPISMASIAFALYNAGLLLLVAGYEFQRRWRLAETRSFDSLHGILFLSTLLVGLGVTAALQAYSHFAGRPIIVLELFRALRFLYLPMYVYLGFFLCRILPVFRTGGRPLQKLVAVALLLYLIVPPRDALELLPDRAKLVIRSNVERSGGLNRDDPSQSMYLQMLLATDDETAARRRQHQDFLALCSWARTATGEDSVFLTTDYDFIHYADRRIMVSYAQGAGSARSMAMDAGYEAWHEAYLTISGALESGSASRILAAARRYRVDYAVVSDSVEPLPAALVYENPSYRVYRIGD